MSRKTLVITNRSVFEHLIDLRLKEAKLLMDQIQDWDGAYYLAGHAVECALKVRIIALLNKLDHIPERRFFEVGYSHSLNDLRQVAGLEDLMESDAVVNSQWDQVSKWDEQSRYQVGKTEPEARDLYESIESGVLPWIRAHW